jgi:DNA (cytosine-5)-methyltransferase 1
MLQKPKEKLIPKWRVGSQDFRGEPLARVEVAFDFIDLFAGIGGMRIGFQSAGGRCVFSSEWDVAASKTYEANFRHKPSGDITKIQASEIPDFDVLLAGFPCQPFSSIGKREGFLHKTQGTLFNDVLRIVTQKKPKAFLLENVKGLTTHDGGDTLETILEALSSEGYELHTNILDSSDYGLPQIRERIYIVGFLNASFTDIPGFLWPAKLNERTPIGPLLEQGLTDRSISKHLQDAYLFKLNDGRPQIVDKSSQIQVKTLVASYHKIQRLSGTFVADGPTGLRLLSVNECKAIMGFPKDFVVPVSRTQAFRQFGNSVAVPVVSAIAQEIAHRLKAIDL